MANPLLSLCMIVKNEEQNLPRCLDSVKGIVDEIIIVDTGSTDKTVEIAKSYGARVYFYEWQDDFSGPRNLSIDKAKGRWILVLDADEELAAETKAQIRLSLNNDSCEGFNWKIRNFFEELVPTYEMGLCFRVFKNSPYYRYSGDIHEQMTVSILKHTPNAIFITEDILINHYGYQNEQVQKKKKKARNFRILKKQANPTNQNHSFFNYNLGMEYYRQGKIKKAYNHFSVATKSLSQYASYAPKLDRYIISCLQRLKQYSKALEITQESLKKYPDYIDLYFLRGTIYFAQKKFNKAIVEFCKCLEYEDIPEWYSSINGLNSFRAFYYLGLSFEQLLDYEQALLGYKKTINAEPQFTPALHGIIRILNSQGKSPAEIKDYLCSNFDFNNTSPLFLWSLLFSNGLYETALNILPSIGDKNDSFLNYCTALNLLKLKRLDEAICVFSRDNDYPPKIKGPAIVNKCLCYWVAGDLHKAAKLMPALENLRINPYIKLIYLDFQRLLEDRTANLPKIPRKKIQIYNKTVFSLIEALIELSEVNKAKLALTLLIDKKKSNHLLTFIDLLIRHNQLNTAEKLIIENFFDNKEFLYYLLGGLEEKRNNYQQALSYYKKCISLNPKLEDIYLRIPRLVQSIQHNFK